MGESKHNVARNNLSFMPLALVCLGTVQSPCFAQPPAAPAEPQLFAENGEISDWITGTWKSN
jgi:hypothetical protein